ncbi:MAG: serine/threonine protein kinase, partial [Planctomycetota bacterium]
MIGSQVGPYRIESELGSGGMGTVYLADHGGKVALKILHPHLLTLPEALERFEREAVIGQRVQHPNVVRTLGFGSTDIEGVVQHYLVMEYVEGNTLRSLLQELGNAPENLCRHIGLDICRALEAIHAHGVVHRDLKPENVLVTPDHAIKVMDLGVAQLADAALQLSQTGAFLGSVLYAAPEQFADAPTDHRADLYSLGLMLYELASGHHPWRGKDMAGVIQRRRETCARPVAEINPQISPFFEELISSLLATEPDDRFDSAATVRSVLEQGERAPWWIKHKKILRERTQRPLRRVRIPRETSVYGRDDELARMQALFDSAAAGDGQVLLLEGEAGIGKTRLVDEFVSRFGEEVNFLFGSYPPGGAATEAGAFSTAFREQLGDQQLSGYLDETPLLAPAFGALLRGEPPPRGEQPLSKDSLQTVFLQSARVLARERPTILLIDDLHFAPPEGRALFAALAMGVPGHRILLVGTARPELPTDWRAGIESMPHSTRLKLTRLGAKDLAKLLVDYFGSERLAHELSFSIATSSDGNPFFVFEIIRGLREGNYITRSDDGSWITSRIIEKIEIPSSVAELIQARISTLCEEDHEILDVASCCGFDFDATVVADVIRQPRIPTFRRLARITNEHRLVHASGRNFVFDHHQVQETLYAALPEILREEYHAAIGNALEQRDPRGSELVHLCKHFFLGGQPERAQPHLDAALEHLSKGYLHEAALELLDR